MPTDERAIVYALASPRLPRRLRLAGHELDVVHINGIDVVLERDVDAPVISEEVLREHHSIVVELARRADALLPVRFGSVMDTEDLRTRISDAADPLRRALEHVRGRAQMTVRIFGVPLPVMAEARPPATGTEYLRQRRDRARATPPEAACVVRHVASFVIDERIEAGDGPLRATIFHLIALGDVDRYRAAAEASRTEATPLQVTITGPWPAFAFAPELW